jgi:hypothetical protein
MRSIEQFLMAKPTECTLPLVRLKDPFSKCPLVQPHPHRSGHVRSSRAIRVLVQGRQSASWAQAHVLGVVDGNSESQASRIVLDNEDRPGNQVLAGNYTVYVHER